MARSVRVQQLSGVTGAVALVCERPDAAGLPPSAATDVVQLDAVALTELLATIDPAITILVFLSGTETAGDEAASVDDRAIAVLVDRLAASADHVAAVRRVPAVNAAKRVHEGVVVEAVDRTTLNLLRSPEVVDRAALEAALDRLDPGNEGAPINPTVLAASAGDPVLVVDDV